MIEVYDEIGLEKLKRQPSSLLFINAAWSKYAAEVKGQLWEMELAFFNNPAFEGILFYETDFEKAHSSILEWLKKQDNHRLNMFPGITCGAGSLLWLKHGRVAVFVMNVEEMGLQTVVETTIRQFSIKR